MATVYKRPEEVADFDILIDLGRVLERHERFAPIVKFGLRIDLSLAYSDKGDAVKLHGSPALAKIKIIGPEDRARGIGDVRITVDAEKYYHRTELQRDAILAHELYHVAIPTHPKIEKDAAGKDCIVIEPDLDPYGRPVVKLIHDDWTVTGFREVAEWYGPDSAEVRSHHAIGRLLAEAASVLPFMATPAALTSGDLRMFATSIERDTFAALLAVGHTEASARRALDAIPDKGRFESVSDLIDEIYRRQVGDSFKPVVEVDRDPAPAEVVDAAGEVRVVVAMDEDLRATSIAGWLQLEPWVKASLANAKLYTLGDLADELHRVGGVDGLVEHHGYNPEDAEAVVKALESFLDGARVSAEVGAEEESRRKAEADEWADLTEGRDKPEAWTLDSVDLLAAVGVSPTTLKKVRARGVATLGDLDAKVKTLADQDRFAEAAGLTKKTAERLFSALDNYIVAARAAASAATVDEDLDAILEAESDADAEERNLDAAGGNWRSAPVSVLGLDGAQLDALKRVEVSTLGDLADHLAEDGFRELSVDFKHAAKVLAAFELWWYDHGSGSLPFVDEGDCPADRERTALLIDWLRRERSGDTAPAWGLWSEFDVSLEDGSMVSVVYDPQMVARPDPRDGHFEFHGPLTGTGYRSHHTGPAHKVGAETVVDYATRIAREVAAETAKTRASAERRAKKGAKQKAKPEPELDTAEPLEVPPPAAGRPGVYTVHPAGMKHPTEAVLAPSKMAALYYAKARYGIVRVEREAGQVAALGLAVIEVDASGSVVAPVPVRVCNLCNTPRAPEAGVCPNCQSPEFRLGGPADRAALEAAQVVDDKPKRERAAAKTKPRRKTEAAP